MNILVFAPHPDDEVLGCGGSIKKWVKEGNEVYVCMVTKAYTPDWTKAFIKKREGEIAQSAQILGIKKVFFLDLPTVKLDSIGQKQINDAMAVCVQEVSPEVLYIPHKGDLNKDHQIVFESALVISRTKPGSSIKKVLSYETLSETEWGIPKIEKIDDVFLPNVYIDISDTIDDKLEAMQCYASELKEFPHPRSLKGIMVLSEKRGMEAGINHAEAFMMVKEVIP